MLLSELHCTLLSNADLFPSKNNLSTVLSGQRLSSNTVSSGTLQPLTSKVSVKKYDIEGRR